MYNEELNKKIQRELINNSQIKEFEKSIPIIEGIIGYVFTNKVLLIQAFTRSSYSVEHGFPSNEVLEFIGDEIIDFAVVKKMVTKFGAIMPEKYFTITTNQTESDFTEIKKKLVCNENLASIIDLLGFDKYLFLGKSDTNNNVSDVTKVKADLLEAIISAIAIDSNWNFKELEKVCEKMINIDSYLCQYMLSDKSQIFFDLDNSINVLKELAEHGRCSTPIYVFGDKATMDDGNLVWSCACFIRSHSILEYACASSKKMAKKQCAYLSLCKLFKQKN